MSYSVSYYWQNSWHYIQGTMTKTEAFGTATNLLKDKEIKEIRILKIES